MPLADPARAPILLLVMLSTVLPVALNMYIPALANMRDDLGTTDVTIQLTLSLFLAASAVGQLIAGPLSDIYGRRPTLIGGLSLFLFGTGIAVLAPNIEWLLVGRTLQGLGACVGLVIPRAIVRDIHGTARAASMIGYLTMGMAVAPLVSPFIGGVLYEVASWRALFVAMGTLGAVGLTLCIVRLGETHTVATGPGVFARWGREMVVLSRLPAFWSYALTLGALNIAFFSFLAAGTFVAQAVFSLSAASFGAYFAFIVTGYLIGNFVTGRYGAKIGIVPMIRLGNTIALSGILAASALALWGATHPLSLFVPVMVMGVGNGFALPNCVAGCVSVRPDLAGTASGLAGALQTGSGALSAVAVGALVQADWLPGLFPMLVPMILGASAALCLAFTLKPPP
ncbi:MAG: multidrug effflux MFS transporter [Pseudomonadota bacterium]